MWFPDEMILQLEGENRSISTDALPFVTDQTLLLRRMFCLERGTPSRSMAHKARLVVVEISVKEIVRNRGGFFARGEKEQNKKNCAHENDQ